MSDIPNIPQIPKRWDQLLFVAGLGLMYFNQGNAVCFVFGVFLLGVGVIIALGPFAKEMRFKDTPNYDEERNFVMSYLFGTGLFLFLILAACFVLFPT